MVRATVKDKTHYVNFVFDSSRWEGFEYRPGDIVISTPPKAGTTWTQRICSLLIFGTDRLERPLALTSPWLEMLTSAKDEVFAELESQQHRRFIKSHTPYDGLPIDERVTYVCVARDPRDIAFSWENHIANSDLFALMTARQKAVGNEDIAELMAKGPPPRPPTEEERFWGWVEDETPVTNSPTTLAVVLHHLTSFWRERQRSNVVLLHYADLKADLEGQMRTLANRLGITIPEEKWPTLVAAAQFDRMKNDADMIAPDVNHGVWKDNKQFFARGTSGQWRDVIRDDATRSRYAKRARELASDEVLRWAHGGELSR